MKQQGQILLLVVMTVAVVVVSTMLVIGGSQLSYNNATYAVTAEKATAIAEAGLDKAVASLNKSSGSYTGESETSLGDGSYSVTVTTKDASTRVIKATGYIPNKTNPKVKREISIQTSKGDGFAFNYGMQVGEGGINMANGAIINGSVYSNGSISTGNSARITGDVYVAGGVQPDPDQQSDCTDTNCSDFIFGKNVFGNMQLDAAQSFKPSTEGVINKVSLKLKKFGSPPDLTIRILGDNNGKPNKTVKASGILYANLVSPNYGFIDVSFTSPPTLDDNTTYWIMIDTCGNSTSDCSGGSNYWAWSSDSAQGYTNGVMKWSPNWNATNPVWNANTGDLGFKTFMGGVATTLSMSNGSRVDGNVHVNTITGGNGVTINGNVYFQNLDSGITVNGTKYPNSDDPSPGVFPISDANITDWKNQAEAAGVTTGNVTGGNGCHLNLGPGKIVGNISLGNGCILTVKSPLWITGNFSSGNSPTIKLDSSAGSGSGMIIVDGTLHFANGADVQGSGTTGSYLMMLTTYDSTSNGIAAIDTGNGSVSGILYAPKGIINLANGASFKEMTGWGISMGNSAVLNYETGLANIFFSSGPSGSYSLIKGTYQAK